MMGVDGDDDDDTVKVAAAIKYVGVQQVRKWANHGLFFVFFSSFSRYNLNNSN